MPDNQEKPIFLPSGFVGLIAISFFLLFLFSFFAPTDGFDPLDPNGNVTIKWDILVWNQGQYEALVSIYNYQLFRHIETPGWRLSWTWTGDEIIWHMTGAEATEQGNCSRVQGSTELPHSCEKTPVIIDLLPGTPYNLQTANCCKGGVLTSMTQDPINYAATFRLSVGMVASDINSIKTKPVNFGLGLPGYSCSNGTDVPASRFTKDGRRNIPSVLQLPSNKGNNGQLVRCSRHMCPIRIHWHVKTSYTKYWRVKVTVENLNVIKNYSMWNLVIQHPNLQSIAQMFSFNYQSLNQYPVNDTGMFWGIKYYNDMLLQAGNTGNVQNEMILSKDTGIFTFKEGWAFPRRVSFNGDECVMPPPDEYPRLPNSASPQSQKHHMMVSLLVLLTLILS
ncbi:hypothetical protein NE237_019228 [Protea cynaroides]|uniref:COBRA C-terminal domain-containing protein n=1 Tax=Protea cynaroides TaxID=273540 RepID=A0A9Q0QPW7_9MAGN|nr:hypothetical protein NE237_019228 [Protea cynaroides]